ncbi:facilitated trehalose transporter Tret1-2 homolog isoform X1 [Artemia franciscana]|uniref:facilitated trehalose transporter Tret1-2 homolog isoform X1 n=1 Tax=Artemia franciscana TaxID=6661 RepID=UPI0032DA21F9
MKNIENIDETFQMKQVKRIEHNEVKAKLAPQLFAALAAHLGAFTLGAGIGWSSPSIPQLDGSYTKLELSLISSLLNFGAFLGSILGGILVDKLGRKRLSMTTSPIFVLGFLLVGLSHNLTMFVAGRLLIGVGGGIASVASPIYVAEISSPRYRGAFGSGFTLLIVAGITVTYTMGIFTSWSTLSLISIVFPLCNFVCMFVVPESPNYLIIKDEDTQARNSLIWLRGKEYPYEIELSDIRKSVEATRNTKLKFRDLITAEVLKPLFLGMALMFFQQFSGINAALYNLSSIFSAAGGDLNSNVQSVIVALVQLTAALTTVFIADLAGRKVLLSASGVFMTISHAALGTYFYFNSHNPESTVSLGWLPLASLILYITFYSFGFGPLPWAIMGEILPVHVKGTVSSIISGFSWGLAFLVTFFFESFIEVMGESGVFWMFGSFSLFSVIYVIFYVPETKGKTLQEIQRCFK